MRVWISGVLVLGTLATSSVALGAGPAPNGKHPRLFLDPQTLATMKAKAVMFDTAARRAIDTCADAADHPERIAVSGYQGDAWAFTLSSCALAFQLTGKKGHAEIGVKLWRAALADLKSIGDGKACFVGATDDEAIAAIKRDHGYAIRFLGPHTALAYDWLHDAPGVDEALRAHSRSCFRAWLDWYAKAGYLPTTVGANYHAGYAATKVLVAIAEAGEDGATSARFWSEAVDDVMGKQIVGKGLTGAGPLVGGDWAEGWQYGPLSVVHYALAGRALEEQGVKLPELRGWASDLALRFTYGLTPSNDAWVGGDTEGATPYIVPGQRTLAAAIFGPSSNKSAGVAAFLRKKLGYEKDAAPVFDALAEARAVTPTDPTTKLPHWYLAKGTRTVYARSSFASDATWAVFTSPPRLVPDHQHFDAGNFVLSRGADALVVDPSPYSSLSTLTGNAVAVDSAIALPEYRPSQTYWSEADLPMVRGTRSGLVAARSDFAKAFRFTNKASDVPFARRDWVYLPEGEIIVIDRTRTDDAARATHLRFRTPGKLTLTGATATAKVGGSTLAIHRVVTSGGTAAVKSYPATDGCWKEQRGHCANARFPIDEYALTLPGPRAVAVHVLDALGVAEDPAVVTAIGGAAVVADGAVGASLRRGKKRAVVVSSAAKDGEPKTSLGYVAQGDVSARHVVFDAPSDGAGRSKVTMTRKGDDCVVSIEAAKSAAGAFTGRPLVFTVSPAAEGCGAVEEADVPSAVLDVLAETNPSHDGAVVATKGGTSTAERQGLAGLALLSLGLGVARRRR